VRSRHARVLAAVCAAAAVTLAVPRTGPTGGVLDLVSDGAGTGAAIGREPSTPGTDAAPPAPISFPDLRPSTGARGVPPERTMAEPGDPTSPPLDVLTGYVWPIRHPRLTDPFGPSPWGTRLVDGTTFHDGVDLATGCGDRIVAAHAGTVLAAGRHFDQVIGWVGDLGPYFRRLDRKHAWSILPIMVVIDDGNGYRGMYAHFGRIVVRKGEVVKAGQLLGYEGATGHATGCHLHYGLFSPLETRTMAMVPAVAKRLKLPRFEIARVDPLKVLPPKPGINAP
jgi:murein DD-endopeptidase MepM/ murein hydrolase activator NlpD